MQPPTSPFPPDLMPIGSVVAAVQREFPTVSHSSLRFLEREGLLQPTRTAGGHRLYSRADVDRVLQIKRWQEQRLTLDEIRRKLESWLPGQSVTAVTDAFLGHLVVGNLASARHELLTAEERGLPLHALFGSVLVPAMFEVGRRWEHGTMQVSQEKEISELARDLIAEITLRRAPARPGDTAIVAAGVEGELHELGLRMICGMLRAAGHAVHYLGANVASPFLVEAVSRYQPAAVLLSAKLDPNFFALREAISALAGMTSPGDAPVIIVGGAIVRHHADALRALGAHTIADNGLEGMMAQVEALLAGRQR